MAHSWTVTTLELVTAALKMMSGLGNDPSDEHRVTNRGAVYRYRSI